MLPSFLAAYICRLIVVYREDNPMHISAFPTGTCAFCCPIDLDRDVEFQLYTRRNPVSAIQLRINDLGSLNNSTFLQNNPTIVYIHGYSERAPGLSAATVRNAYLSRADFNVILVDWGKLAAIPWYITAVQNTRVVGAHIARMLSWLESVGAVPLARIHVIGFSLGAEAAGFTGKALVPRRIGRITGLDAAYPLYMDTGADGHLTKSDASFVDVIHTDGGIFGFPNPLGHADFYPNGGVPLQPGCNVLELLLRGRFRPFNNYIVCGHNRAWRYYAESVTNPTGFPASRCPKWRNDIEANCSWRPEALMGFGVHPQIRGKFYLRTNERPPFARGVRGYV